MLASEPTYEVRLDKAKPPLIVTLVHGTWGVNSQFTRPNSELRRAIRELPNPRIGFLRFRWSGANGNASRLAASARLAAFLSAAICQYPDHKHIVIAHSHGGNVLLSALADKNLSRRIAGIITVGTPFLLARKIGIGPELINYLVLDALKDPSRSVLWIVGVVFVILDTASSHFPLATRVFSFLNSSSLSFLLGAAFIAGASWLLMVTLEKQFRSSIRWSDRLQAVGVGNRMLCLFAESDEAGRWLGVLSRLRSALDAMLSAVSMLLYGAFFLCGLVWIVMCAPSLLTTGLNKIGISSPALESLTDWLLSRGEPFALAELVSFFGMVLLILITTFCDLVVFASPLGFGAAEWRHGWFVRQVSRLQPPVGFEAKVWSCRTRGLAREFGWFNAVIGLRHSMLFKSRSCQDEIRAFIASCN